jgi:hypothetical protein
MKKFTNFLGRLFNPPAFIILIKNREAFDNKGNVSSQFISECTEIAKSENILEGKIYGMEKEYGISLVFSNDIPESSHQRFRNVWNLYK